MISNFHMIKKILTVLFGLCYSIIIHFNLWNKLMPRIACLHFFFVRDLYNSLLGKKVLLKEFKLLIISNFFPLVVKETQVSGREARRWWFSKISLSDQDSTLSLKYFSWILLFQKVKFYFELYAICYCKKWTHQLTLSLCIVPRHGKEIHFHKIRLIYLNLFYLTLGYHRV